MPVGMMNFAISPISHGTLTRTDVVNKITAVTTSTKKILFSQISRKCKISEFPDNI